MTRKRVTASEKKQRHEWAVRQIDAGMGLSELTAFTAETWGCSRRQARDVVAAAHKDWLDACYGSEEIDQRDLLFQQVGRLERIALKPARLDRRLSLTPPISVHSLVSGHATRQSALTLIALWAPTI